MKAMNNLNTSTLTVQCKTKCVNITLTFAIVFSGHKDNYIITLKCVDITLTFAIVFSGHKDNYTHTTSSYFVVSISLQNQEYLTTNKLF